MELPYSGANVAIVATQAATLALTGAGGPRWLEPLRGRAWSLVLPLSLGLVVAAIAAFPGTADGLTWLALVAVPPLAAAGAGWAARGARPWLAALAVPLLVVAWAAQRTVAGDLARLALVALSCVALGRLLLAVAPREWIKAGVVVMAVLDAILVFSTALEQPNATLNAALPAPGLPQLQYVALGGASMGYGDFFVAGVTGAVLAAERLRGFAVGLLALVISLLFDLLFAVFATLPATVPIALTLLLVEASRRPAPRRRAPRATRHT